LPGFDGETFGIGFHNFVTAENEMLGWFLAPIFHIATLVLLALIFRYGNRFRRFIGYGTFRRALRRHQSSTSEMAMAALATGITQSGITGEKLAVSLVIRPRGAVT
jgi:hypothetical protein